MAHAVSYRVFGHNDRATYSRLDTGGLLAENKRKTRDGGKHFVYVENSLHADGILLSAYGG